LADFGDGVPGAGVMLDGWVVGSVGVQFGLDLEFSFYSRVVGRWLAFCFVFIFFKDLICEFFSIVYYFSRRRMW
jgi:hypothetical protein